MYFFTFKSPLNIDMWFYDKLADDTSYFASQYLLRDRHKEGRKKTGKKNPLKHTIYSLHLPLHTHAHHYVFVLALSWVGTIFYIKAKNKIKKYGHWQSISHHRNIYELIYYLSIILNKKL